MQMLEKKTITDISEEDAEWFIFNLSCCLATNYMFNRALKYF